MDKIEALKERLNKNLAEYREHILGFAPQEILDMAGGISDKYDAHLYMTEQYEFSEEQAEYFLRFENPLEMVADRWGQRQSDLSDMSFDIEKICYDRQADLEGYDLVGAADAAANKQPAPRKPTLLDRCLAGHEFYKDVNKLLPDLSPEAISYWISYANRTENEGGRPATETYAALTAELSLAKQLYGAETAALAFHVAFEMPIPPTEIPSAAAYLHSGGDVNDIIAMSLEGKLIAVPEPPEHSGVASRSTAKEPTLMEQLAEGKRQAAEQSRPDGKDKKKERDR